MKTTYVQLFSFENNVCLWTNVAVKEKDVGKKFSSLWKLVVLNIFLSLVGVKLLYM